MQNAAEQGGFAHVAAAGRVFRKAIDGKGVNVHDNVTDVLDVAEVACFLHFAGWNHLRVGCDGNSVFAKRVVGNFEEQR